MHMEGSIETQQYGFIEKFEAKHVWDTAYLVPKIWVTIFIERWVSISNFQFDIVLCNVGRHSLDSKFFSFWKQLPEVFYCPILVINLTTRNLF